jgi:hypothetical protein
MIKKTSSLLIFWALILFFASICWGKEVKIPAKVNPTGKYKTLIQVLPCPKDKGRYGEYYDYGYWGGGDLCGEQGEAGFWVWSYPNWYIFKEKQGPGVIARQQKTFSQNIIRQWAKEAQASSEYGNSAWSARQATGSPDTKACGDYKTAWAPKPSGNEPEWIKLFFQQPVHVHNQKYRLHRHHVLHATICNHSRLHYAKLFPRCVF